MIATLRIATCAKNRQTTHEYAIIVIWPSDSKVPRIQIAI